MRIGALFAGYGGLEMGVQSILGGDLAWVSEIDKGACKILAHRYPDVPNVGDVTTADWSQVEPVDILTGGSPCQDLSHAGRRAGMTEGTRSNLWVAMREAIAALRPSLVVWENVRGALSAPADNDLEPCAGCVGDRPGVSLRALGRVLGDLADLGYDCRWHGLRAADVGAPHGRWRVFVVAHAAGDAGRITHGDGAAAALAANLGHERAGRAWDGRTGPENGSLLPTPSVADATGGHERRGGARGDELLLNGVVKFLLPTPMVGSSSPAAHGQISGQYRDQMAEALARWGDYAAAIARWEHVLGRPAPAPTMTSTKGNPQLAPAFVEWLMGLPAGWVTDVPGITRNEALKALGNGVVPAQAAAALRVMASWVVAA